MLLWKMSETVKPLRASYQSSKLLPLHKQWIKSRDRLRTRDRLTSYFRIFNTPCLLASLNSAVALINNAATPLLLSQFAPGKLKSGFLIKSWSGLLGVFYVAIMPNLQSLPFPACVLVSNYLWFTFVRFVYPVYCSSSWLPYYASFTYLTCLWLP